MPRPKQTIGTTPINTALPTPVANKLALELYSEIDGRIPIGAYKQMFTNLLEQHWAAQDRPCPHCSGTGVRGIV